MAAIIAVGVPKEKPVTPTMSLPVDALASDGVEPEVGDEIEHSIKGKITKISGDTATISVTALDGAPVEGSPEEESAESPEEESAEEGGEDTGSSNPGRPSNPGPARVPVPSAAGNPLAAALAPPRAARKARLAAMGNALRQRARGGAML